MFFILAAGFENSCVADAMVSSQIPLVLPTMMLLVVSLVWLTDVVVQGSTNQARAWSWFLFASAMILLSSLSVLFSCSQRSLLMSPRWPALVGFAPVVGLFLMAAFWRKGASASSVRTAESATSTAEADDPPHDGKSESDMLVRWGKLASLIIMILALFAFGLHHDAATHHVSINWAEVPAILVVFVLAELGVNLVVTSRRIDASVQQTAGVASEAIKEARSMADRTEKLKTEASSLADRVSDITTITIMAKSLCHSESEKLKKNMGVAESSQEKDYWDKLGIFVGSWNPHSTATEWSQKLLRILFENHIGKNFDDGSVRSKRNSVVSITSDAVYIDASEEWLAKMCNTVAKDEKVVVWAVSRLLPTEFALPSIWVEGRQPAPAEKNRANSLERFITAVIRACRDHGNSIEYKRVTVFDRQNEFKEYVASSGCDGECNLDSVLDNWMVWDPRVVERKFLAHEWHEIADATCDLGQAVLGVERKNYPRDVSWLNKKNLCESWGHETCYRIPPPQPSGDGKPHLFKANFGADDELGLVLGASKEFLEREVSKALFHKLKESEQTGARVFAQGTSNSTKHVLESIGWRTIRDWYCTKLHTNTGDYWEAWWALKGDGESDPSPFNDQFFGDLALEWNGTPVLTLDVLLIGTRKQAGTVDWHGAIISNLSLERTECTIQLKTDATQLAKIADVVRQLSESESEFSGRWQRKISHAMAKATAKSREQESIAKGQGSEVSK